MALNVLIGCEETGTVRDAFLARGHNAYSNDLIPARSNQSKHLLMDVMAAIDYMEWDLIILHPPCTALCAAGNKHYGIDKPYHDDRLDAIIWTRELWLKAKSKARIGVALENPRGVLFAALKVKAQYIQPYQFGHLEQKLTGLALHNLPKLQETNNVFNEMMLLPKNKRERIFYMAPSETRGMERSETFSGIADAFAEQWGALS